MNFTLVTEFRLALDSISPFSSLEVQFLQTRLVAYLKASDGIKSLMWIKLIKFWLNKLEKDFEL